MLRTLLLHASKNAWMRDNLPRFRFARAAVKRFMPGEDAESALKAGAEFKTDGIPIVVTYLGENVTEQAESDAVLAQYARLLDQIHETGLECEVSVKLTQLGHDLGPEISFNNVKKLARQAEKLGNFIWIDMEDSSYVDATLDLYRRLRSERANVGVCLQSCLYRTANDLDSLLPLRPAIRLVKGAYKEPPDRAFPRKAHVDENYFILASRLLDAARSNGTRVGIATHDPKLIDRIRAAAEQKGVPKDGFEIQMLFGIRTDSLKHFVRSGNRGRILISYGPAWYPWYMRRLAERPANLLFVLRNLLS